MAGSAHGLDTPRGTNWYERGSCRDHDPELWFPTKDNMREGNGDVYAQPRRICAGCKVRPECLDHALTRDERFGMWAGLSPLQRAALTKAVA